MAILKKGSRRIVVDGHNFLWRIRQRPTYSQGLCQSNLVLAVADVEACGSTLVVTVPQPRPDNWLEQPSSPVLPSQVAGYIRQAMNQGWQPTKPGKTFLLKQSELPAKSD